MAQRVGRRGSGGLARRFGVLGRVGVALAVVTLLVLGAAAAAARGALSGGVVVERAAEEEAGGAGPAGPEGEASERGDAADARSGADPVEDAGAGEGEAPALVVHVDGAVVAPGVYELPAASRVNDAVLAAGGLVEGADTGGLNLAAPLADGEKVHVPREGEAQGAAGSGVGTLSDGSGVGAGEGTPVVNINTAGVAELDELPGVGEATARAIVEDRERNGPFSAPEDLMRVSGIGEKKFAKMEGMVCV